jgi:hypothetical protein
MKNKPCPICADWKYKSLVKTCPICGGEGGLNEVNDLAAQFMLEQVFEDMEAGRKVWDKPYPCPNSGEPGWEPRSIAELDAIYYRRILAEGKK